MSVLLSARQLACERGGLPLFEGLELEVGESDLVQVTGPNGAGKTSFLRLLAGLARPTEGSVQHVRPDFLYLGHQAAIKLLLTPLENLQWYFPDKTDQQIVAALAHWDLAGYEDCRCVNLSAGQRQRVALARLELSDSLLWLMDEPFTAIDRRGVEQLEARFVAHAQKQGAVVFTSHQSFSFADKVREFNLEKFSQVGGR